jgi:quinol monooxygenase YgiN
MVRKRGLFYILAVIFLVSVSSLAYAADDGPLTVLAIIKAKPGMEDLTRKELLSLVPQTHKEPACINYDMHVSLDDKGLFMFYENWTSRELWEKHMQMPYLVRWSNEVAPKVCAKDPDLTLWKMLKVPSRPVFKTPFPREPFTLLALIRAKSGMEDRTYKELLSLVPQTHMEPGCISYDMHLNVDDPSRFMFYENWRTREIWEKHMEMPYLKRWANEVSPEVVAEDPELTMWEMLIPPVE